MRVRRRATRLGDRATRIPRRTEGRLRRAAGLRRRAMRIGRRAGRRRCRAPRGHLRAPRRDRRAAGIDRLATRDRCRTDGVLVGAAGNHCCDRPQRCHLRRGSVRPAAYQALPRQGGRDRPGRTRYQDCPDHDTSNTSFPHGTPPLGSLNCPCPELSGPRNGTMDCLIPRKMHPLGDGCRRIAGLPEYKWLNYKNLHSHTTYTESTYLARKLLLFSIHPIFNSPNPPSHAPSIVRRSEPPLEVPGPSAAAPDGD